VVADGSRHGAGGFGPMVPLGRASRIGCMGRTRHVPATDGLLIRTGRARIEALLAFGTGEGDADRWSAGAGEDTAGCIDVDRKWGIHRVVVRAVFASEKRPSDADSQVADTEPFHSKSGHLR
jgi:hypothetical protein